MFKGDMNKKRAKALQKVKEAITLHGGQTILSTGITGDDARLAKAVCEAGVKLLEPNHPALALARGHKGVSNMHAAEQIRHEITNSQMAEAVHGVRNVVPDDIFITVGIAGGFTEPYRCRSAKRKFWRLPALEPTVYIRINPTGTICRTSLISPINMV